MLRDGAAAEPLMRINRLLRAACLAAVCSGQTAPVYQAGMVTRPGGAVIAYHVRHAPVAGGATLVLIPGSWNDHRIFDRFMAELPPTVRVVIVELPGHGESRPTALHASMAGFAQDVLSVVDWLRLGRFYVGGHSIGGMLAIEIAGRRPNAVAGVVSMEGWTHHLVSPEAFAGDIRSTMTPEQQKASDEHRERVRKKLSPEEIAAFAAVWKQWDGMPILQSTRVPILEIWGDRGRPRPSRGLLRIPERPNLELEWMPGVSHSLLIQCPVEVSRATQRFMEKIDHVVDANQMFTVPGVENGDFSRLPHLPAEVVSVYRGIEGLTGFNMHPYVASFGGRLWAMWSSNRIRDLRAGQYVRYATSPDGVHWSESAMVTHSEEKENWRYFARGFWCRNGDLIALAARDEAVRPLFGPGLELRGYRWNQGKQAWEPPFVVAGDTINNFPPEPMPAGEWMMSRRDHRLRISMLVGGVRSPDDWKTVELPKPADEAALDEPIWWALPNHLLSAALRDGSKSRRIYRSISRDGGNSWSAPVRSNFPDATAKFNVLRLRSGLYVMASSPNPSGQRVPLCLSTSSDGIVFNRMAILRDAPTIYRYPGKDPGYAGYHYPQLLEHDGQLYVIHSENMEDVVLLRISMAEIERLAGPQP